MSDHAAGGDNHVVASGFGAAAFGDASTMEGFAQGGNNFHAHLFAA
jgi:hypothetical protein